MISSVKPSFNPLQVLSSAEGFGFSSRESERGDLVKCEACEADKSQPVDAIAAGSEVGKKVKIGVYFAHWWTVNVMFNIYNKKVLNAFPYPWLMSTLSLAVGSLIMLVFWATRITEAPKNDLDFRKTLLPDSWCYDFKRGVCLP